MSRLAALRLLKMEPASDQLSQDNELSRDSQPVIQYLRDEMFLARARSAPYIMSFSKIENLILVVFKARVQHFREWDKRTLGPRQLLLVSADNVHYVK
jgi:hypothetical protein